MGIQDSRISRTDIPLKDFVPGKLKSNAHAHNELKVKGCQIVSKL